MCKTRVGVLVLGAVGAVAMWRGAGVLGPEL